MSNTRDDGGPAFPLYCGPGESHCGYAEPPSGDTPLLDFLREESLDLRCISVPTGGGDYGVRWLVVGHYERKPRERLVGESFTDEPRDAIKDAMANTDARGSYGHPAAPAQEPPSEFSEIRAILDETYNFVSAGPRAQENINAVSELLDKLEAAWKGASNAARV